LSYDRHSEIAISSQQEMLLQVMHAAVRVRLVKKILKRGEWAFVVGRRSENPFWYLLVSLVNKEEVVSD